MTRYGRIKADAHFDPSGEPVEVSRPFERIFMDGTEYDHSVFWSESMKEPEGTLKMKGVMAMCAFSQFVFPYRAFAGPYRPEHGMRALLNVMVPPTLTDEEIEDDPDAALIYGIPSDVMIDRDKTLIPPRAVPGTVQITSTLELAEAYHSDAKGKLENFHKFVKARLADKVKGRILGPRVKYDIGYDPLKATEVTRAQYVDLVEQCRRSWNTKSKTSLGERSPQDIMMAFIRS